MYFAVYVPWPVDRLRVERAHDSEATVAPPASRFHDEALHRWLAVVTPGPEISEIPASSALDGRILPWIHRTIEHAGHWRTITAFNRFQRGAAGKGEIHIVPAD